jgi:hydroxymethylpyrimidine/phosphomethylpyrimidine kinase
VDKHVLSIAGFDPSGCAGIAVDLKTFLSWNVHGLGVITAITAQNTQRVSKVYPVPANAIRSQLEAIASDIEIHAVKIGLLPDASAVELIASLCEEFKLTNIIVDPVLRSSTGFSFADQEVISLYEKKLFPIADVITPNIDEASIFSGMDIETVEDMKSASQKLQQFGARRVVITGGHLQGNPTDVLYDGVRHEVFDSRRIAAQARGLGCTFSSILAIHLARNQPLAAGIESAKNHIGRALSGTYKIGKGRGPLNHNL